jgi:hypothetical protein
MAQKEEVQAEKPLIVMHPTPQRTQMWAQVAAEEEGIGVRSLAHNT